MSGFREMGNNLLGGKRIKKVSQDTKIGVLDFDTEDQT